VAKGAVLGIRSAIRALILAGLLVGPVAAAERPGCKLESGPARGVAKVIDGETLELDDKSQVRLLGALAPQALDGGADEGAWPPADAAKTELEKLALGKSVELRFASRRSDRYGRLLAHVFVREGSEHTWLQEEMLRRGYARAYALPGSTECLQDLVAAEDHARRSGLGIWGHASYQIRPADRHWELLRYRSTYQLVEGKVRDAAKVRGRIYLNFGENWREDFTITVQPTNKRVFDEAGMKLTDLKGRRVRVRGWIERRGGPLIEIYHPSQLEVLPE
jgi:endonuclease YncB( thermonuclease family)